MKTKNIHIQRFAGFTLVELAIVLLIIGILMSAGLSLATVKRNAAQRDVTQTNQLAIKQALISFLGKYQRLPCPASAAASPITGAEAATASLCSNYYGIVPYQALGLDRSAALDGWENFITYVVSPVSITPALATTTPPLTTSWLFKFSTTPTTAPCTTATCTNITTPSTAPTAGTYYAFWPSTSTGGITVKDTTATGGHTIADPTNGTGAVVALISYGANGLGAFNIQGGTNTQPAANTDEFNNFKPYQTPLVPLVVKRDPTDSTSGGGSFDDMVMIMSANDLTGPLVANGTFQNNAMVALNQANDNVIGHVLSNVLTSLCSTNSLALSPLPASCSGWNSSLANYGCLSQSQYNTCQTCVIACGTGRGSDTCINACPNGGACQAPTACVTSSSPAGASDSSLFATYTYYTLPVTCTPVTCSFPTTASSWGVSFTQSVPNIAQTTTATNTAYTLTAGDGTTKTVTVGELQGIISRASGF